MFVIENLIEKLHRSELEKELLSVGYSPLAGSYYGINTSKE